MNELQIFNNPEFGEIRTIEIHNEPWLVGKDVATVLGYNDTDQALRNHVDEDDKLTRKINGSGQTRSMTIINESGLYSLVLSSKLSTAKKFRRWVTSEVLPSIRKEGSYIAPELKKNMAEARLLNARARVSNQWMKLAQQVPEAEYKQICASYASAVLAGSPVIPLPPAGEKHLSAHEVGKLLGVSANQIGRIANQNGLKTEQYGKWFHDKSPHSVRQVEVFMYNSSAVDRFRELLHK